MVFLTAYYVSEDCVHSVGTCFINSFCHNFYLNYVSGCDLTVRHKALSTAITDYSSHNNLNFCCSN